MNGFGRGWPWLLAILILWAIGMWSGNQAPVTQMEGSYLRPISTSSGPVYAFLWDQNACFYQEDSNGIPQLHSLDMTRSENHLVISPDGIPLLNTRVVVSRRWYQGRSLQPRVELHVPASGFLSYRPKDIEVSIPGRLPGRK